MQAQEGRDRIARQVSNRFRVRAPAFRQRPAPVQLQVASRIELAAGWRCTDRLCRWLCRFTCRGGLLTFTAKLDPMG